MFTAKSPIQLDSGSGKMFGWWPRHHARMLVPDRGDPMTKIGLFTLCSISRALQHLFLLFLPNRVTRREVSVASKNCLHSMVSGGTFASSLRDNNAPDSGWRSTLQTRN